MAWSASLSWVDPSLPPTRPNGGPISGGDGGPISGGGDGPVSGGGGGPVSGGGGGPVSEGGGGPVSGRGAGALRNARYGAPQAVVGGYSARASARGACRRERPGLGCRRFGAMA